METKVKICGITNLDDALAAVEAGADALGLMFYEASPRCISIEAAQVIAAKLPPHILRVGVFVDPEPDLVMLAMRRCDLSLLQFHGERNAGILHTIRRDEHEGFSHQGR